VWALLTIRGGVEGEGRVGVSTKKKKKRALVLLLGGDWGAGLCVLVGGGVLGVWGGVWFWGGVPLRGEEDWGFFGEGVRGKLGEKGVCPRGAGVCFRRVQQIFVEVDTGLGSSGVLGGVYVGNWGGQWGVLRVSVVVGGCLGLGLGAWEWPVLCFWGFVCLGGGMTGVGRVCGKNKSTWGGVTGGSLFRIVQGVALGVGGSCGRGWRFVGWLGGIFWGDFRGPPLVWGFTLVSGGLAWKGVTHSFFGGFFLVGVGGWGYGSWEA